MKTNKNTIIVTALMGMLFFASCTMDEPDTTFLTDTNVPTLKRNKEQPAYSTTGGTITRTGKIGGINAQASASWYRIAEPRYANPSIVDTVTYLSFSLSADRDYMFTGGGPKNWNGSFPINETCDFDVAYYGNSNHGNNNYGNDNYYGQPATWESTATLTLSISGSSGSLTGGGSGLSI